MKAKLINALFIKGQTVNPKAGEVVLIDLDDAEFERLLDAGKIAKPSERDLKVGRLVHSNEAVVAKKAARESASVAKAAAKLEKLEAAVAKNLGADETKPADEQSDDAL